MNGTRKFKSTTRVKRTSHCKHSKARRITTASENDRYTNAKIRIGNKYQVSHPQINKQSTFRNNVHPSQFYAKLVWDSSVLPESQVSGYLELVRHVWPQCCKYREEIALYMLTIFDYNVIKLKEICMNAYSLIEVVKQCSACFED